MLTDKNIVRYCQVSVDSNANTLFTLAIKTEHKYTNRHNIYMHMFLLKSTVVVDTYVDFHMS